MQIQPVGSKLSKYTKPNENGLNFCKHHIDNIYHEGNISKMQDFDVFSLSECRKRTARSHGIKKNGNCKLKSRVQKLANCTLRDLTGIFDVHSRHSMLSYLSSLPISVLSSLDTEANKFTIDLIDYMMLLYLLGVILNMLFAQSSIPKLIT